jgi:lysine 2,3-aminomutase
MEDTISFGANDEPPSTILTKPDPHSEAGFVVTSPTFRLHKRRNVTTPLKRELTPSPQKSKSTQIISPRSQSFRSLFYPNVTDNHWNDWRWQLRNRIRDFKGIERIVKLSDSELSALSKQGIYLPVGITPYYASLLEPANPDQPLRRTVLTTENEFLVTPDEADDPLGENGHSPVPGLVHRYPDRVLFLTTGFCAVYCRYCTRSRVVGNKGGEYTFDINQWNGAIEYIKNNPVIRDVIISGGDPLTLSDDKLEYLLSHLRAIPHIEILRLGTKVPVVLPQRITPELTAILQKYHPLWMSIHFTHPDELTPEVKQACERLANAGMPLGSQTVLLKGINDNVDTMKDLVHGLLKIRVRPYYLYQCDPVRGSSHFRTTVDKGIEIIRGLRGHTSGYAVPHYVIDAPGGGGKIPLLPEYFVERDGDDVVLRNYENKLFRYSDPDGQLGREMEQFDIRDLLS